MSDEKSLPTSRTALQDSTDESIRSSGPTTVNRADAKVEDRSPLMLSVLALIISGMNLLGIFWAISEARRAEREAELLQLEVHGFKNALHALGVKDVNPHLPGESS